jgi:hypothetical protein
LHKGEGGFCGKGEKREFPLVCQVMGSAGRRGTGDNRRCERVRP